MDHSRVPLLLSLSAAALVLAMALLLLPAPFVQAAGPICSVPGTYATIQAALNDTGCATINLATQTYNEHLTISRTVTINGNGTGSTVLDGGGSDRVISITAGIVNISRVTIQNGSAPAGGGISNQSNLTLSNSNVFNNSAGLGGGIATTVTLTLNNTTLISNTAEIAGGILNEGTMVMNGGSAANNLALVGGGIANALFLSSGATPNATLNNVSIAGNLALIEGGGILNDGILTVNGGSFSNNSALLGGGLSNDSQLVFVLGPIRSAKPLTLRNGRKIPVAPNGFSPKQVNNSTATLTGVSLTSNTAGLSPLFPIAIDPFTYGGGILNFEGTVNLNNVNLSQNKVIGLNFDGFSSPGTNGGLAGGGGIYNLFGILNYNVGTLSGNSVTSTGNISTTNVSSTGGGITNVGAMTLTNLSLIGNIASTSIVTTTTSMLPPGWASGGGISNGDLILFLPSPIRSPRQSFPISAVLNRITFAGNTAVANNSSGTQNTVLGVGGGMVSYEPFLGTAPRRGPLMSRLPAAKSPLQFGPSSLTNVTFNGNIAASNVISSALGGGFAASVRVPTSLVNVTISGNTAPNGFAGGILADPSSATLLNTLLGTNVGGNCPTVSGASPTSQGYNLSGDTTCQTAFNQPGDKNNQNPMLGPLANNGGLEQTMALLAGSPAIDAASPTNFPPTDERGVARPRGPRADIGAYEYDPPAAPVRAPAEVPEGDTLLLFGGGVGGLATWLSWQWRRSKNEHS